MERALNNFANLRELGYVVIATVQQTLYPSPTVSWRPFSLYLPVSWDSPNLSRTQCCVSDLTTPTFKFAI